MERGTLAEVHLGALMHNYMAADILACVQGVIALALFMVPPGYLAARMFNIGRFRELPLGQRLQWAVVLSIAVTPITAVLVGRFAGQRAAIALFAILAAVLLPVLYFDFKSQSTPNIETRRFPWLATLVLLGWVALAIGQLVDLQFGHRLYPSIVSFDQSFRTDFVQACIRTGTPPHNPYYLTDGQAPVMRYFYYWYVVCGLACQVAGIPGRAGLIASSAWAGIALASVAALYVRSFLGITTRTRTVVRYAITLLAVTGLDLIPSIHSGPPRPDMEWWDNDQISSWNNSLLWVPHHTASLIACLAGFLVLWCAAEENRPVARIRAACIAALAFSSAAGLSVYVVFTFALFMVLWTLLTAITLRWADLGMYLLAGLGALLLAIPYLQDLRGPASMGRGFASLHLPGFIHFDRMLIRSGLMVSPLTFWLWRIPALGARLLMELGFFFVVLVLQFRKDLKAAKDRRTLAAWLMVISSLFVVGFLRSSVIGANDLGWRAALIMQFVLLLWGAVWIDQVIATRWWRRSLRARVAVYACAATLAIGVAGTIYQAALLRTYLWLSDTGHISSSEVTWMPPAPQIGERVYEMRATMAKLDEQVPSSTVVQRNPKNLVFVPFQLFSRYQAAAGDPQCGDAFGGDPQYCSPLVNAMAQLYGTSGSIQIAEPDEVCARYSIDVLVADDTDPAWSVPSSWVWQKQAISSTPHYRAIRCGVVAETKENVLTRALR